MTLSRTERARAVVVELLEAERLELAVLELQEAVGGGRAWLLQYARGRRRRAEEAVHLEITLAKVGRRTGDLEP